jgi:hypothetical protein
MSKPVSLLLGLHQTSMPGSTLNERFVTAADYQSNGSGPV